MTEGDGGPPPDASLDGGSTDGGSTDAGPDSGMCTPQTEMCNGLDEDCDKVPDSGFNLLSDPKNCGTCGTVCNAPNRTCCAGVCKKNC